MVLFIILIVVFVAVALMVLLGEKFGQPMSNDQQRKYAKIVQILVFVLLVAALIKMLI